MNPRAMTRRKAARRFFGYDAAAEHSMRRQPAAHERSEDDELPADKRRKVVSRARDARRNQEIAAWAIRKHLDFTSDFRSSTGVKEFDDEINAFVDWWSLAENCDVPGDGAAIGSVDILERTGEEWRLRRGGPYPADGSIRP